MMPNSSALVQAWRLAPLLLSLPCLATSCQSPPPSPLSPEASIVATAPPQASTTRYSSAPSVVGIDIEGDGTLRRVRAGLPSNWRLFVDGSSIVAERVVAVWVLDENQISKMDSNESPSEREARIRQYGRRMTSRIIFATEPRWSDEKLAGAAKNNASVAEQLQRLPDKHGVRALVDATRSRKNPDPRIGATPQELPRVEAYLAERKELGGKMVSTPAFATQNYSLFSPIYVGWADAYHIVSPHADVEECYRVDESIRGMLATGSK